MTQPILSLAYRTRARPAGLFRGRAQSLAKLVAKRTGRSFAEVSVAVVGEAVMRRLNATYRGERRATDVLSFTYRKRPAQGEVVICLPVARRQARARAHTLARELEVLLVHGLLHLAGFDHEEPKGCAKMRAYERAVLGAGLIP